MDGRDPEQNDPFSPNDLLHGPISSRARQTSSIANPYLTLSSPPSLASPLCKIDDCTPKPVSGNALSAL